MRKVHVLLFEYSVICNVGFFESISHRYTYLLVLLVGAVHLWNRSRIQDRLLLLAFLRIFSEWMEGMQDRIWIGINKLWRFITLSMLPVHDCWYISIFIKCVIVTFCFWAYFCDFFLLFSCSSIGELGVYCVFDWINNKILALLKSLSLSIVENLLFCF